MTTNPTPLHPAIRIVTVASVCAVAFIAAVVSYAHMQQLAQNVGENWRSWLIPLSIDGLVVASSMTLLTRHRAGMKGGQLPWIALAGGVTASLAANMADARHEIVPVLLAGWAPVAFAIGFELLLMQRRAERLTAGTPGSLPTGQLGAILPRTEPTQASPVPASTVLAPAFSSPPPVDVMSSLPTIPQPEREQIVPVPPRSPRPTSDPARARAYKNRKQPYVSKAATPDRKREAARYFETDPGMTNRVIAERLGVTDTTIRNYRREWQAAQTLTAPQSHTNGRVSV